MNMTEVNLCEVCNTMKHTKTAMVNGKYYQHICNPCSTDSEDTISSNAAGYDRRRSYEDNAQDTVQPYNANGPNSEFLRLYPNTAKKVFSGETIEKLKRKI